MTGIVLYILIAVVLFTGSALQATVGFGYGLFAVPVLLLLGLEAYEAMAIVGVCVILHGWLCIWRSRHELLWRELAWLIAIGCVMQPLGNLALGTLVKLDKAVIGQVFGVLLLAGLAVRAWVQPKPREKVHPFWGVAAMTTGGLLSGLSGMGGPPIVLWLMAHQWSQERVRVTMWTIFSTMALTNLPWLFYRFGEEALHAAGIGLLFLPVVLLGTLPGMWAGKRMSHDTLRRMAVGLLVLIGLYAIFQPMLFPAAASAAVGGK